MTVNLSRGISTSMFFRLCSRALWMTIALPAAAVAAAIGRAAARRLRQAGGSPVRCSRGERLLVGARAPGRCASAAAARTSPACRRTRSRPPRSPPSGPRSMIQSAARITSRLCSMTSSECPAASSLRNARSSLATSSKCRPVVGSSNRNSLPRWRGAREHRAGVGQVPGELQALRLAAGERRHRLAELHIFQAHIRQRRQAQRDLAARPRRTRAASVTVISSTSAMFSAPPVRCPRGVMSSTSSR